MSPTDLDDILSQQPFIPLRLTLSSGDQLVVDNPARTVIAGLSLYVAVSEHPEARIGQRMKVISIPNINLIERVEGRGRNGGRRRRA